MKKNREKIALLVGAILVSTILIGILYFDKKNKEKFYLSKKLDKLEAEFLITTDKFDKISEVISKVKINQELITSTIATKDFSRRYIIFNSIYDDFRTLKSYGYKSILFILPDGRLFLDMENPAKYGMRMVDIDNIVVISNTIKNSMDKRFYDSMVYSYPLFYREEFVGTAYFIIPLYTVGKNLSEIFKNIYVFYIKKDYISLTGKKGFVQTEFSKKYFVDKQFYNIRLNNSENVNLITEINTSIKEAIRGPIEKENSFSIPYQHNNRYYLISFYSIRDITGKHIGYLVSYEEDNTFFQFSRFFYISSILTLAIVILVSVFVLYILKMKHVAEKSAITDKLTGALNRTAIEPIMNVEYERAKRSKKPISLIIFDIDFFKKINDTYGHNAGDFVLKKVVEIVKGNIRKSDYLIRWGGEEFLILLPETDIESAVKIAEKLRKLIELSQFKEVGKVTVSLGVTQIKTGENLDQAIKRADEMLYLAKNRGRNRVEFSPF